MKPQRGVPCSEAPTQAPHKSPGQASLWPALWPPLVRGVEGRWYGPSSFLQQLSKGMPQLQPWPPLAAAPEQGEEGAGQGGRQEVGPGNSVPLSSHVGIGLATCSM